MKRLAERNALISIKLKDGGLKDGEIVNIEFNSNDVLIKKNLEFKNLSESELYSIIKQVGLPEFGSVAVKKCDGTYSLTLQQKNKFKLK